MNTFIEFVTRLIYGTGGEAEITPNHSTWVATHWAGGADPFPVSGTEWLTHHLDRMLPAYENWRATHYLPPIVAWKGTQPAAWDSTQDIALPPSLEDSLTGITSLDQLGVALRDHYLNVALTAIELGSHHSFTQIRQEGLEKAPFSYRFWGFIKWASLLRDRFNGEVIIYPTVIYDRDGTILSPIPFTAVFNELHWSWHTGAPTATGPTPGFDTSVGQRSRAGGVGMSGGEEFIRFHSDHVELFSRWLARTNQPPVRGINMYNGNTGWPTPGAGNPSTWVEADDDPWINTEMGDTDNNLRGFTDLDTLGSTNTSSGVHGAGHTNNPDIAELQHNNYVPRFFAWHGWIDNQWRWREPRFAVYDSDGLRDRTFEPVLADGSDWPGLHALTIVRDPAVPSDTVSPAGAVTGLNLTSGVGTLRMRFLANDSYDRPLRLSLRADVFDDATDPITPVETVTLPDRMLSAAELRVPFEEDFTFAGAFQSDDPGRSNPAVGFVNSRIRVTGTLEVADGTDPNFVHTDFTDIHLVQEKQAPDIDLYFDLSSFGQDQVNAALTEAGGGEARFTGALIVVVQDRTSAPHTPTWPAAVADEVKGLLTGRVPAAGLFDDAAHAPEVEILELTTNTVIAGLSAEPPTTGPILEDSTLADNLPQRFTYRYDIVFQATNDAFTGLATGAERFARVRVRTADRAGNMTTVEGQIKLFNEANPFMRDGDPSWLSIDTRVFRLFEGEPKFGTTLNAGQPNAFIQQVIQNLNMGTAGSDTFDGLPENQAASALEYSPSISNPSLGTSQNVHNFALAKVRLQGAAGAAEVRAFFRLFRYTSSNLVFDPDTGYRTHDDGAGRKVPKLGFETPTGGDVISIPFFAEDRVPYSQPMTDQTDTPNVQSFPSGPTAERVLYFGVYLDINQDDARLPGSFIAAHPDGGFNISEVTPLRSLMMDAHQCMVVEIHFDGDPTNTGDTPANSDNLAQRNLMILTTDNPGALLTHTVQHSFDVDLGKRLRRKRPQRGHTHGFDEDTDLAIAPTVPSAIGQTEKLANGLQSQLQFISAEQVTRLAWAKAASLAVVKAKNMEDMMNPVRFLDEAREIVEQRYPFRFDTSRWQNTTELIDELLFLWNDLPREARVEVYLPRINCEQIINLRHLRHAPGDVRFVNSHTLELTPDGVTYLPLPPTPGDHIAGIITVELPEGIRKGQQWQVDVVQLRGGERRTTGGFQLDIQVSRAEAIADAERRLLEVMHERLGRLAKTNRWYPVLRRRVETIRARAQALAEAAGLVWEDPTVWVDPDDPKNPRPLAGEKVRVVLEKIQILEDRDPWIKGPGEIRFKARVRTESNGGIEQSVRLPEAGVFKISDKPGRNVLELNKVLFTGYATDDLRIEVVAVELDTFDPDDTIGKYTRIFSGDPATWLNHYGPGDEAIDPEDAGAWRLWYHIERA